MAPVSEDISLGRHAFQPFSFTSWHECYHFTLSQQSPVLLIRSMGKVLIDNLWHCAHTGIFADFMTIVSMAMELFSLRSSFGELD